MKFKYFFGVSVCCFTILFLQECKVPYDPPLKSSNANFLVVEGYLDGNGPTTIKLSRTRNITWGDTAKNINETGAHLQIEDENNNVLPLTESGNGVYSGNYFLYEGNKYRLRVIIAGHKEYISDFVRFKQSPPIDNINWNFENGGVQIYANTHDPQNKTRFYRWSYDETWQFRSFYYSYYRYDPSIQQVVPRNEQVYDCWQSHSSTSILLGSSARLKEDVISKAPLVLIPENDKRINVMYSILVTQYALDSAGYNYWNAMKSNTENVGSIFDPQPNQTRGNIHCTTDSSEVVIGYISAGTTQQQRIFISNSQMPSTWHLYPDCTIDSIPRDSIVFYLNDMRLIPIDKVVNPFSRMAYTASSTVCTDCTFYGTNIKPSFWP